MNNIKSEVPTLATMKADVLELVTRLRHVSFVEVQNLPGATGHYQITIGGNVVLWQGLSEAAANAIIELRAEGAIHCVPTHHVTYHIDGAVLTLPLVRGPKALASGYKSEHWLPVVIQPGPHTAEQSDV